MSRRRPDPGARDARSGFALDRPRFKKIKARYGYQFDVRVRASARRGAAPAWGLGFTLR